VAILISASNIRKAYAARPLFDAITFAIETGDRIGLIGPNGAGKSTLLRILASQVSPDEGQLSFQRGIRIGYLEQIPTFAPHATIQSTVLEGTSDPDDWECVARAQEIMSKLSLDDPTIAVQNLSGGWRKRVALARELVRSPDLLLLDEPTNHLDVESILWLETLLADASFATLTITHDRLFLQRIANRILELDRRNPGGLLSIKGSYADYLDTKDQIMAAQERQEVILKNTLRRETEWLRQGAKARTTKQQARIKRAEDLNDKVQELTYRNQVRTSRIDFQSSEKNPKKLIEAKRISKSYDSKKIFSNFDLIIGPGSRIGILGSNGCGKSTLIKALVGQENCDEGVVLRSENLSVAYFEQNRDTLDPVQTVAKTLCPQGEYVSYRGQRIHIRSYLDRFLFTQGQMDMAVGKLSGGEQSRLLVAKLMLQEANLLVLDEPTNDLDMATLTVLAECLTDFTGAILLVTHDRYFLDQVATQILAFEPKESSTGQIVAFASFSQWEDWYSEQKAKSPSINKKKADSQQLQKKRKLGFKEQRELDSMEANIQKAEAALEKLTGDSQLSVNTSNSTRLVEITQEMNRLQAEIDRLYARWAELEA
jgi:ATP-binding cassette subfamily F protein uup